MEMIDSTSSKNKLPTELITPLNSAAPTAQPIFAIHPVGGQVIFYNELAKQLQSKYKVYGIHAIGLHGEAPPLDNIETMADIYLENIRQVQAKGPYSLLGWSMGGLIALQIAELLLRRNEHVLPILLDTNDPSATTKITQMDKAMIFSDLNDMETIGVSYLGSDIVSWRVKLSLYLLKFIGLSFQKTTFLMPLFGVKPGDIDFKHFDIYLDMIVHDLSTRDVTQFPIDKFVAFLKNNRLIAESIDVKTLASFYEVFRANYYAAEHYQPAYYPGNVLYFKAAKRTLLIDWQSKIKNIEELTCPEDHYHILKNQQSLNIIKEKLMTLSYG